MSTNSRLRLVAEVHRARASETHAEASLLDAQRHAAQFEDDVAERERPRRLVEDARVEHTTTVYEYRRAIESIAAASIHPY